MTLLELLVTIAIFAIVILVVTTIMFSSTRLGARTSDRADAQGSVRQTLSLMTTEIRQAGADPSIPPVGIQAIVAGDSVSLRIRADLNGNGVIQTAEPSEDVTYAYSGGVLTRDPGTGPARVAANLTAMEFSYYDPNNVRLAMLPLSIADAASVRSVGIRLTVEEGDSQPITLESRITLRNR
jgi:type II secretory pathway component PulJ